MIAANDIIAWLLAGDPAIRWQTLRDLLDAPEREWRAEPLEYIACITGTPLVERRHSVKHIGAGKSILKPWFGGAFVYMLNTSETREHLIS